MTANGTLPQQSREAAIEALLQVDDGRLIAELGGRVSAMEFNRSLAGEEAMAPAPGFTPEGIGEDVLALGSRVFSFANRELYCIICGDSVLGQDERRKVADAMSEGDSALTAAISGVLISALGLAPIVATVVSALVVKRVFMSGAGSICERWAIAVGEDPSAGTGVHTGQQAQQVVDARVVPPSSEAHAANAPGHGLPGVQGRGVQSVPATAKPAGGRGGAPYRRKSADGRICMDELIDLVRNPSIPRDQLHKYFILDVARSGAFRPKVEVNADLVEAIQLESAAAAGILNFFYKADRQRRYTDRVEKMEGNFLRLVSEGDSWFQYPLLLNDVIDQLFDRYPIYSLGEAGDVLSDMVDWTGLDDTIAEKKAHGLLFSGGGNDLLGDGRLSLYLKSFQPDLRPAQYINENFTVILNEVQKNYQTLFDRLTKNFPHLRIFCHGYDYAIPRPDGKWLGQPMVEKGIEDATLQRQIVRVIVDIHNSMMINLARGYNGRVILVDCRGVTKGRADWYDELHPTDAGYARAAMKFQRSIDSVFGRNT